MAHHPIAGGHIDHAMVHQERDRCAQCSGKLSPRSRHLESGCRVFLMIAEGFTKGMLIMQAAS